MNRFVSSSANPHQPAAARASSHSRVKACAWHHAQRLIDAFERTTGSISSNDLLTASSKRSARHAEPRDGLVADRLVDLPPLVGHRGHVRQRLEDLGRPARHEHPHRRGLPAAHRAGAAAARRDQEGEGDETLYCQLWVGRAHPASSIPSRRPADALPHSTTVRSTLRRTACFA